MKTLLFIFFFFLVPFFISAQSGCNSDFNYTLGNCPTVVFFDNSTGSPQPFGGEADIVTRIWSFGDGATSNSTNPTHQYQANGTYNVCLTIFDASGCSDQFCTIIQITCIQQCEAMFQYSYTASGCPEVEFDNSSFPGTGAQIVSWSWSFGDGTTGTEFNPTHEYTANGTYTACLVIETSNGCVSDFCATVEINCISQCEALFQFTTGLCPTIVFADNSTPGSGAQVVSWSWDFGDGSTGTGPSQTHEYTANGAYNVCLIIETSDGCVSDYCTTVEINCITQTQCEAEFQYSFTASGCPEVEFSDLSSAGSGAQIVSWEWGFGDGTSGTGQNPTHEYTANGTYTVCLIIVTSDGCESDFCTTVEISCIQQTQCEAAFQYSDDACPEIEFYDFSQAGTGDQIVSYTWDFGDGSTGTGENPTHEYQANGIYIVCLIIETLNGCVSDYCYTIVIDCINSLEETNQQSFTIYPNPVSDYFNVDLLKSGSISYRIIGVNGVEYGHGDFKTSASHTIDVRFLKQGIYLIEFEVNGQRNSERFIKM